jgi:hypothetical protein
MDDYSTRRIIEGKGVLFQNLEPLDDGSPDFKGEILYKGELIRLGGWVRHTDKGVLISLGIVKRKGSNEQQTDGRRQRRSVLKRQERE